MNLEKVQRWMRRAHAAGASLVVFPEATMQGFGTGRLDEQAEPLTGPFVSTIHALALELGITVVAGVFTPADQHTHEGKTLQRIDNVAVVCGNAEAAYAKMHTYDAFGYRESDTVRAGNTLCTFTLDGVTFGLGICFDVRFPEQFRELARRGAEVLILPASWNSGEDKLRQWQLLTAARALDSTAFFLACGQAEPEDERNEGAPTGIGHSRVIGPVGDVRSEAGPSEELLLADIDPGEVAKVRATIPVL